MVDFYFEILFSVQEFHNTTTNVFVTNFCYHLLPRISPCFMPAMSEFRCQILGLRLRRLCNIAIDKKGRARARAGPGKQAVSAGCLREWMEQSAIKRAKNMNMPYLFDFLARPLEDGGQADRTQAGETDVPRGHLALECPV